MKVPHPSWATSNLDEIGEIFCGQSVSEPEVNRVGRGTAYVTGPEQWNGRNIKIDKWTEAPRRLVPEGCIFITVKGAGVGKTFPGIAAAIGRDIYAYKPARNVFAEFVHRAIRFRIVSLIAEARGDIPGLSREHLADHPVLLPPFGDQRRIVAELDALTARLARARAELERVPVLVVRFKQRAMAACFEKAAVGDVVSFDTILSKVEAGKNLRCEERPPRPGERGVVKVSAVTWGRFDPRKSKTLPAEYDPPESARIRAGDLLIYRANTLELVGAVVIVEHDQPNLFLSDKILRLIVDESVKKWALWFLRSPSGRHQIEQLATGNQLSMRNISQDALRSIKLPLPRIPEREQRISQLEAAFARADRIEEEATRAKKLLDRLEATILAKAFRGELVPQDPADEPAAVLLDRIRAERAAAPKAKRGRRVSSGS